LPVAVGEAILAGAMNLRLELVPVPVSDIDRAKAFYVERLGFTADHDVRPIDEVRVVQLTPPGSACSIVLGRGLPSIEMATGSLRGLHLVVDDIDEARARLAGRGLDVGEVDEQPPGGGIKYAAFDDPDGNTWTLQELP
jgi:catechol 2,3-dioxygenase-like lactoylglutathione lyase family enzyme